MRSGSPASKNFLHPFARVFVSISETLQLMVQSRSFVMTTRLRELYASNTREGNLLFFMLAVFLLIYFVPAGTTRFDNAVLEAVRLTNWYAREHVILCLLPAFLIAGAMSFAFFSKSEASFFLL